MDKDYFSDKHKTDASADGDDIYLNADYFDENFSLNFRKGQGNAQSFQKKEEADEELFTSFAGKEISDVPVYEPYKAEKEPSGAAVSRTPGARAVRPQGARATHPQGARPVKRVPAGAPSRTPTGRKVDAHQTRYVPQHSAPVKRKAKKSNGFKITVAILSVLIILVGSLGVYAFSRINSMLGAVNYDDSIINDRYLPQDTPVSDSVKNILLIGSDERGDGSVKGRRSDTMILFTIDTASKQIKLTSFLRDSYVYIPCIQAKGKMNSAYSKDGAQGVIDTIEYNYSVDVHNYVSINFTGFEKVVDLMGGITVDGVTAKEARFMNSQADTNITEGSNHMNGYEALWYCRIRKLDSDFYRTMRQRKVMAAIIDKAKTMKITDLMNLVEEALPFVSTDLSKNEITSLAKKAVGYIGFETVQQQIPADGTWRDGKVNGSYVIDFDIEENKALLKDFVYGRVEKEETTG